MIDDDGSFFAGLPSLAEIQAAAAQPLTGEEIADLVDPEELNGRVALRLYERYGWHEWPAVEMPDAQRVDELYEAMVTPQHGGSEAWSTPRPMPRDALIAALRDRGCHRSDIGDAFYEADPEWQLRP